ncbi:MAG: FecR domain-containing protein [Bacteroidota bacterium]
MMPQKNSQYNQWVDDKITKNSIPEDASSDIREDIHGLLTHTPNLKIDKKAAWNTVLGNIKQDNVRRLDSNSTRFYTRIAAAVVLLIISGVFTFQYLNTSGSTITYTTVNLVKTVELADGSSVTLNRNSTLTLAPDFNEANRNTTLQGEAVFQVRKMENQAPFVVNTENGSVKVLGTVFNVDAKSGTTVYVKEGRVAISNDKRPDELELQVGELGKIEPDGQLVKRKADDNELYWQTKKLYFKSEKLSSVIERINEQFNAKIEVSDALKDCTVTLSVEGTEVDDFIRSLNSIMTVTASERGDSILLDGESCKK